MVTVTKVVRVVPPEHLMEQTPGPDCSKAETNGDLVQCILDYRDALGRCNADKVAIKGSLQADGGK